jgi:hypothetical protein
VRGKKERGRVHQEDVVIEAQTDEHGDGDGGEIQKRA